MTHKEKPRRSQPNKRKLMKLGKRGGNVPKPPVRKPKRRKK